EDVRLSSAGAAGVRIGYCPQQDALDDFLTGWEHLHYYCCLRGIPKQCIPEVAGDLVRHLHLETHVHKLVATYSGGTKRKLSTALALLGKPDLLLLDEPSSGMDPCSKRYLWKAIAKEVQEGCAVVLTSHSMEECEALCTRLAVMVRGSCRCLGSPQHIKNRVGRWIEQAVLCDFRFKTVVGYEEDIPNCVCTRESRSAVVAGTRHGSPVGAGALTPVMRRLQFKGQRHNLLEYDVPKRRGCLADLFKVLENHKNVLKIRHYFITQTSLEQVFINFATEQQQTPPPSADPASDRDRPQHLPI
ncbi:ATP-binding cassette sub-family A member 13, partial [Camelus dromedarius]